MFKGSERSQLHSFQQNLCNGLETMNKMRSKFQVWNEPDQIEQQNARARLYRAET